MLCVSVLLCSEGESLYEGEDDKSETGASVYIIVSGELTVAPMRNEKMGRSVFHDDAVTPEHSMKVSYDESLVQGSVNDNLRISCGLLSCSTVRGPFWVILR